MKKEDLFEVLQDIDEEYVKEAREYTTRKKIIWVRWVAVAATFVFVIAAALVGTHFLKKKVPVTPVDTTAPLTTEKPEDNGKKGSNGTWEYMEYENSVTLTKYLAAAPDETIEELVIPDEINSKPVTDMAEEIFKYFNENHIEIDKWTLNEYFVVENGVVFNKDKTILFVCNNENIGDYTVPYGVKKIYAYAFHGTYLISINLPNTLTTIGENAFWYTAIESIAIPDSVTYIGAAAFADCTSLKHVKISKNITALNHNLFGGMHSYISAESITIPDGVTYIGSDAIVSSEMKSINIPASVKEIDFCPFGFSTKLSEITVDKDNKYFTAVDGVLFTKDMSKLIYYPTGKAVNEYTVPDGVKEIADFAFYLAPINKIVLPNTVKTIGRFAFYTDKLSFNDRVALSEIIIPSSVTSIDKTAFGKPGEDTDFDTDLTIYGKSGSYIEKYYNDLLKMAKDEFGFDLDIKFVAQ